MSGMSQTKTSVKALDSGLDHEIRRILTSIEILPRRIVFDTPQVTTTVPMLRGVWGRALRCIDRGCYTKVFMGDGPPHARTPGYVLRPAPPHPSDWPAVDWLLFGDTIFKDPVLIQAWAVAGETGLGKNRRPFCIKKIRGLNPELRKKNKVTSYRLFQAAWPIAGDPASVPCRLRFRVPLRIMRHGCLISTPNLSDIIRAGWRRIESLAPENTRPQVRALTGLLLDLAGSVPQTPWEGGRLDLVRWSGSQNTELDIHGVAGSLDLPEGAGVLWRLLAVATWCHIGKTTTVGLGQLEIEPING